MKSLCVRVAAVGLLAAVFGGSAQAAPMFYNWYLDFTFGPLTGQEFRGTISVDGNACPGGTCVGNFTSPPPATSHPLLSLNITVGGVPFALANDTGFGSGFPDVTFNPLGQLSAVDYQGQVISGGLPFTLDTSGANVGEDVAFYQGTVIWVCWQICLTVLLFRAIKRQEQDESLQTQLVPAPAAVR